MAAPTRQPASATGRRFLTAAALLAVLAAPPAALAAQTTEARDTVVLTSGKELRGRVVRIGSRQLVLRIGSVDRTIARDQVRSVASVAVLHRELLAAWQDTSPTNADALLQLALRADAAGLPHEAKLLRWYAVLQRPKDAAIHQLLGNRQVRGSFVVEIDKRAVPFEKADALGEDFENAWRLRSEHFALRCAAGLRAGLDTLMELEGLYWIFQGLFGEALDLLELVEPIDVRLYRTRDQMPNLANTVGAYFADDEPALYTFFEDGRAFALEHEATHALLHYFLVRAARSRGSLPAWLDEGWAEYMDGRIRVKSPGKPQLLERSVLEGHVALLASAPAGDRYGVHRILNFKSGDFSASTRQDLKYAQSWAVFRWLFEHQDPRVRALFLDYLREAARGQGQASTFRRTFARFGQELETEPWKG